MRYFGSKVSTIESVYNLIAQRVPSGTLCDPFGGTGIVGSYFKTKGYSVVTGDMLTFAYYFQIARVKQNGHLSFRKLRKALNLKSPSEVVILLNRSRHKNGWFVREYSEKRQFFTSENARHIESCRTKIQYWFRKGWLTQREHAVLLVSLINCMDKVANTAGTYYAYLKKWYRKALVPFRFELIHYTPGNSDCYCYHGNAIDLVDKQTYDILYLDPPYNERNYASYYHLPETIARGKTPKIHGMSGIPNCSNITSEFNKPEQAQKSLETLLEKAQFQLLVFHYADNGIIAPKKLRKIFKQYGKLEEFIVRSKGYTTTHSKRTVNHRLYFVNHG